MKIYLVGALGLAMTASISCHRRPLDGPCTGSVSIPIGTVWEKSEITPQNVTAYFYNQADGSLALEHRFENISAQIQSYVTLPAGSYDVAFHNEIREQITNVSVRGYDDLSTLEFFAQENLVPAARLEGDTYLTQPGATATAIVRNLEVVYQKENQTLIGVVPEQKNSYFDITVYVKGLNNARMPALVNLRNVSSSYWGSQDHPSTTPATIQFTMNNRTYEDENNRNGTISATVSSFGTLADRLSIAGHSEKFIYLDIFFMLVDEAQTVVNQTIDITQLLQFSQNNNGSVKIVVTLELNEPLPEVTPEGSDNSGFGSDVEDWSSVDVPLDL
ncbi:MAG: DUF5119 domain-containing protein [Phocaeicola sp.]